MSERIPLEPIASSSLSAIGYNPAKQILAVQFKNGTIFHYAGISLDLAGELGLADSKGSFYAKNIRGKFQAERMTGVCSQCGDEGWIGEECGDCGCSDYQAVPYKPKHEGTREEEALAEAELEALDAELEALDPIDPRD